MNGEERDALARARAGERDAFDELYRRYASRLLSYLVTQVRRREDAEDLVGQVFLEAMRGIARFEGDEAGFRAWLFRIGRDRAVDAARRAARRPEAPLEDAAAAEPHVESAEHSALASIERTALLRAVAALPDAQREVIALRLGSGLTSGEIARVVGKDVNAVKALQHRAIANLAKALDARGESKQNPQNAGEAVPDEPPPALGR